MSRALAALCLALACVAAGCAAPDGANGTPFEGDGFRVRLPDGWQAQATDPDAWPGQRTIALVSNQALDPQCDGPGATNCRTPLTMLGEGSVLAWWITARCAGAACQLPDGERLLIGGREARRIAGTGLCADLGATSEVAYVVAVSPQRLDAIVACDRDAPASVRDQLQAMIEAVDWRTP